MEYLKGHAVSLHRRESPKLLKVLDKADDATTRGKLFKHAHLKVKEVVVRVTRSNQRSGCHWEPFFGDQSFAKVQPHELALILTHLRNLVVAYDNMTPEEKRDLATVRELVVNLDWLCALAKHCVASDERRYADRERRLDRAGVSATAYANGQPALDRATSTPRAAHPGDATTIATSPRHRNATLASPAAPQARSTAARRTASSPSPYAQNRHTLAAGLRSPAASRPALSVDER